MPSIKDIHVKMEGIIEVRQLSDNVDFEVPEPEDFYHFQQKYEEVPDNFCKKDRHTGLQTVFYCIVCNCDCKDIEGLRKHVQGGRHTRKAFMKERLVLGLELEPQNAPRKKEGQSRKRPMIDVGLRLEERLRDSALPAPGLDFITEFLDPEDFRQHPLYTCSLGGCKSAWGTSDDMFYHVTNFIHQKNFLKNLNPDDERINRFTKNEVLSMAMDYEEEEGGPDTRDYNLIKIVKDSRRYRQLLHRPTDWSERKYKMGLVDY